MMFLQSNRITQIEGLEKLTHLDQLYLSHNGITKIEGLETLVSAPETTLCLQRVLKYTGSRLQRVWLLEIHWLPLTTSPVTRNNLDPA